MRRRLLIYTLSYHAMGTLIPRNISPANKIRGRGTHSDPKDTATRTKNPPRPKIRHSTRAKIFAPRILYKGEKVFSTPKTLRGQNIFSPNTLRGRKTPFDSKINEVENSTDSKNTRAGNSFRHQTATREKLLKMGKISNSILGHWAVHRHTKLVPAQRVTSA